MKDEIGFKVIGGRGEEKEKERVCMPGQNGDACR